MSTFAELARTHTDLDHDAVAHLQRLVMSWGLLADLCFSDLLLFAAVAGGDGAKFVVLGQVRPSTSQTLHHDDTVGRVVDDAERPVVASAFQLGEIVEGELTIGSERARVQCIPVRSGGTLIAVVTRESAITVGRRQPGELERVYVETFDRFARMIVNGEFPFETEDLGMQGLPRVSDGALLLDEGARVTWASPNAVNALHSMGVYSNAEGVRLGELGIDEALVRHAFATAAPCTGEIERPPDTTVLMLCIPFLDGGTVTGGVVLTRDVSAIRSRDRLLLSKDATIREVHHRVKNNLQTISSLLRLQARRLDRGPGRTAVEEAERRIRSIALVHDILSRDAADQVAFNEIVRPLVRMAEDVAFSPEHPVRFSVTGDAGELPADVATPLAVVLNELLQNAVEHAFVHEGASVPDSRVEVRMANDGDELRVEVRDTGQGLPAGFDIGSTSSLGLSIVRDLVLAQLGGSIEMRNDDGAVVEMTIPLRLAAGDESPL